MFDEDQLADAMAFAFVMTIFSIGYVAAVAYIAANP